MAMLGYKNLLVGLAPDPRLPSAALDFGFNLASRFDAHLTVEVDATDDVPVDAMTYEAVTMVETVNDRFAAAAKAICERVEVLARIAGVRCTVRSSSQTYLTLETAFAILARNHDLAILDAGETGARYTIRALFESGRPVIVVPSTRVASPMRHAIVAWDGSPGAARALNDAIPLLRMIDTVELVCVRPKQQLRDSLPGFEITEHLHRHDVDAILQELPIVGGDAIATLVEHVRQTKADLVVMGAFSHSRLSERILGGMTRSMLDLCPVPLFLSHR